MISKFARFFNLWERPGVLQITTSGAGESYSLSPQHEVVLLNTASGTLTLTLPPVSAMAGKMLSIRQNGTGTNATTVTSKGDAVGWSNLTINAQNEAVVLYSDGFMWHVIASNLS